MSYVKAVEEAVNKMLLPYKVTFSDLEDYPLDSNGTISIDGIPWYLYFYIPHDEEIKVVKTVKKWDSSMYLFTLTTSKDNWASQNLKLRNKSLWSHRQKLIHDAYEK